MHPPPFERAVYQTNAVIVQSANPDQNASLSAKHVAALGFVLGLTVDGNGYAWLYIEPADATLPVVRVALDRCRRANSIEGAEAGKIRARTENAEKDRFRTERAAAVVTP